MADIYTYEEVIPTPIENATVKKAIRNGVFASYRVTPNDGYVLHDNERDWYNTDMETMGEVLYLGYTTGTATCGANYDFTVNPREFYAVPEDSVPADQIFGGVNNDHVVA